MPTTSNLNAMLKSNATTNNICLNYNGNHLIATLTDDVLQMIGGLPITWQQNTVNGKAVKQSIYIDKWDEYTSSVDDSGYTVGEVINGKMDYLHHCYLIHADNKALATDAQRYVRQVISIIAPYVGLKKYTITSKTPAKNGDYLSWPWYGTTDSAIKQAFNNAIAEINNGCASAGETLESAKKWIATRSVVDTHGEAYINKSNELVNALSELEKLKTELETLKTSSKSTGKTSSKSTGK